MNADAIKIPYRMADAVVPQASRRPTDGEDTAAAAVSTSPTSLLRLERVGSVPALHTTRKVKMGRSGWDKRGKKKPTAW